MRLPKVQDSVIYLLIVPWRVILAIIIPPAWSQWLQCLIALSAIGLFSALLRELARMFACNSGFGNTGTGNLVIAVMLSTPHLISSWISRRDAQSIIESQLVGLASGAFGVSLSFGLYWIIIVFQESNLQLDTAEGLPTYYMSQALTDSLIRQATCLLIVFTLTNAAYALRVKLLARSPEKP